MQRIVSVSIDFKLFFWSIFKIKEEFNITQIKNINSIVKLN